MHNTLDETRWRDEVGQVLEEIRETHFDWGGAAAHFVVTVQSARFVCNDLWA